MRRSQRLIKLKDIADKTSCSRDNNTSFSQKATIGGIHLLKEIKDAGSVTNEKRLPQLPIAIGEVYSGKLNKVGTAKDTNLNKVQKQQDGKENNLNSLNLNQNQKHPILASQATTAGRKRSANQPKAVRRNKRSRLVATTHNNKIKHTASISIDNYLNPLRNPLINVDTTNQPLENNYSYCSNMNQESLLPPLYPSHFVNQTFANRFINPTLPMKPISFWDAKVQPESHFPTPELTESLDFDSSTSTISLPESLREIFGCDDIRDVLKMDKIIFRMRLLHIQTLAFVLNIEYDYLYNLVQKIMQLDTETLKKVVFAFQPEAESE